MNGSSYRTNLLLTAETALLSLAGLLIHLFSPGAILPPPGVPTLVFLTLIALIWAGDSPREDSLPLSAVLAGGTFALLPRCAGLPCPLPVWGMFLLGGVTFFLAAGLYRSLPTGKGPFPRLVNALGLWLASQGFVGFW